MCLALREVCEVNKHHTVVQSGHQGAERKQSLRSAKQRERMNTGGAQCSRDSMLFISFQCSHYDGIMISN